MSLPGIFRRLFENEGAGPRLLKAILPPHADTHGAKGNDPITPESIGAARASASGGASSADVAVKLKTPRAIDGMGFDGTRSIIHYAVCSTAAATAAKTVNLTGFVLEIGARILVRFDTTNTAVSPTLNVNGTGAKAIRYKNATVTASVLAAKSIREFVYDGAYWQIVGDLDSNTTGKAYVTQTWRSGASWYRVWSDGFIEQGGLSSDNSDYTTITLPKAFTTTEYNVVFGVKAGKGSHYATAISVQSKTTFTASRPFGLPAYWIAMGY